MDIRLLGMLGPLFANKQIRGQHSNRLHTDGAFTPEQDNHKTNVEPVHSYDAFRRGYRRVFWVLGNPPYGCLQYFFYIQTHRC